jgi:predicted TIM-barrel fold metal-dependent hydrolase
VIKRAADAVGAERIVFGSNAPGGIPVLCVEAIRRQDFTEEQLELIFWRNLARIYGIE